MTYEQKIVDHVSILRIFNKCYLTSDNSTQIKRTEEFIQKQHKLIHGINLASKSGKEYHHFPTLSKKISSTSNQSSIVLLNIVFTHGYHLNILYMNDSLGKFFTNHHKCRNSSRMSCKRLQNHTRIQNRWISF